MAVWKRQFVTLPQLSVASPPQRKPKREPLLLCDAVPGLGVRVGEYADCSKPGRALKVTFRSQIVVLTTGATVGPTFAKDRACDAAEAIASVWDWPSVGSGPGVTEAVITAVWERMRPFLEPAMARLASASPVATSTVHSSETSA